MLRLLLICLREGSPAETIVLNRNVALIEDSRCDDGVYLIEQIRTTKLIVHSSHDGDIIDTNGQIDKARI